MKQPYSFAVYAEIIGLTWALGMAGYTTLIFVLSLVGIPWSFPCWIALAIAVCIWFCGIRIICSARTPHATPCRVPIVAIGLGTAVVQVGFAFWFAFRSPLALWDAWAIWALKGRVFALGGVQLGYFHNPNLTFTHLDYPLNVPLMEAVLYRITGISATWLVVLIGPISLTALLALFFTGLSTTTLGCQDVSRRRRRIRLRWERYAP